MQSEPDVTALTGKTYSTPRYVQSCHTLEYQLIKDQIHIQTHHLHKVTALLSKIPTATTLKSFGCHDDNRKLRGLPWRVKSTQITQNTHKHTPQWRQSEWSCIYFSCLISFITSNMHSFHWVWDFKLIFNRGNHQKTKNTQINKNSRYKKTPTHTESSSHVRTHSSEWCLYKHLMNLDIWPNILWQVFISVCNVRPIASDASGPLRAAVQAYWCINLHQFWPPSRET